jgi:LPS-assembly protein
LSPSALSRPPFRPPPLPSARLLPIVAALCGCPAAWADTRPDAPALRLERTLGAGRAPGQVETPVYVRAQRVTGEVNERVELQGRAELRREGTVLRGDRIEYTVATDEARIDGNARVFRDGTAFGGPSLRLKVDALTGEMPDANFSYAPRQGRGSSKLIEFLGPERLRAQQATYTSCAPGDDAWWVQANRLEIDRDEELAVARGARIYFQGVPIFASPYFQFPLGERRRSGVLTPSFAINSTLGTEVTVPWYWDIAPNRDYTIAPRVMTRRGVLLQNEFRYLEPTFRGRIGYDNIPNDKPTGEMRDAISVQHEYANHAGVSGALNFNRVSDDRFFVDFGRTIVSAAQAVLPQEASLAYNRPLFSGAVRVSRNQTLQDPLAPTVKPYERVPQVTLGSSRFDWHGADVALGVEATQFTHPDLEEGRRVIVNPSVSYPLLAPGWFFVPKIQWHYTGYSLDRAARPDDPRPSRSVPLASLDTGLVFEREGRILFGQPSVQTLEPRLFYAYVPYRDQAALPNFDSALADFNFAQLFTENIFVGGDRIGESNQITAALVGRVYDPASGGEVLRAAIGQRYYFSSQRVTLPGGAPREDKESDLLFALSGSLARHWIADVAVQHSTLQKQVVRSSLGLRWQPAPASVLSVAYRYKIDEIEQIDLAGQWPLTSRLYGVGRANFSFRDGRWIEVLAGFEYKADCWLMRFAAQRFATATQTATTTVFLQLELSGLASVGTSPVEQLRRNIPGYQVINPPPREPGRFDYYE